MTKLQVRQYKDSDFDEVWNLHVLALKQVGTYITSGPWDDDLKDIKKNYLDNRGEFLVGLIDNKIVAMGALRKVSDDTIELKRMRVHPDLQGQGYGQKILTILEGRAKELGYSKIVLDTTEKQIAAQNLYTKNGYQETDRKMVNPPGLEFIYFQKEI